MENEGHRSLPFTLAAAAGSGLKDVTTFSNTLHPTTHTATPSCSPSFTPEALHTLLPRPGMPFLLFSALKVPRQRQPSCPSICSHASPVTMAILPWVNN